MKPKDILFQALRHEQTDALPWVPFAGVHAGKLIGKTAKDVLTDEDALFDSLIAVNQLYKPHGQPVIFDLQIEAEVLGCELVWAEDCPPSVKTHPLADTMTVPCRCTLPTEKDGRIPLVLSVMRRMKEAVGGETALYGLVCGPFTLASHLRGNDLFMDMYDDEDYVKDLLGYCAECCKRMAGYYLDAGMDVIAVVDPLVSQISSAHFEAFLTQPYTDIFAFIRERGAFSSFFVCGDASRNIPLTSVMLHGTQQDNMKYVLDLVEKLDSTKNFIVAPGCDMPYAVPVENGIAVSQAVLQPDSVREMLKNYVAVEDDIPVDLPDYAHLEKPLVEVFTLDSATCAACTYMMGAANVAKAHLPSVVRMYP